MFKIKKEGSGERRERASKVRVLCKHLGSYHSQSPLQHLGPYYKVLLSLLLTGKLQHWEHCPAQKPEEEERMTAVFVVESGLPGYAVRWWTGILGRLSLRSGTSRKEGFHGSKSSSRCGCVTPNLQPERKGPTSLPVSFYKHTVPPTPTYN